MSQTKKSETSQYTCNDYREEMILLALRRKLLRSDLSEEEKNQLIEEIARLKRKIGF